MLSSMQLLGIPCIAYGVDISCIQGVHIITSTGFGNIQWSMSVQNHQSFGRQYVTAYVRSHGFPRQPNAVVIYPELSTPFVLPSPFHFPIQASTNVFT